MAEMGQFHATYHSHTDQWSDSCFAIRHKSCTDGGGVSRSLSNGTPAFWAYRRLVLVAAICAGLAVGIESAAASPPATCKIEYWVAPEGNDAAAGDQARPFRSVQRAQDAVRADGRRVSCDVFVTLRAGTYRLGQPLVLDWRDSGVNGHEVTYRPAPGERATISGAIPSAGGRCTTPISESSGRMSVRSARASYT